MQNVRMPNDVYTTRCIVCGIALRQSDIGGEVINGIYIDYGADGDKGTGAFSGCFCVDHWRLMKAIGEEDPIVSVQRRELLMEMDRVDSIKRRDTNHKPQEETCENPKDTQIQGTTTATTHWEIVYNLRND